MHGNVGAARNGAGLVDFRCMHLGRLLGVGMTVALTSALLVGPNALGASLPTGFDQQTLVSGLTRPTAVAWAPDGRLFVAGKDAPVHVASPDGTLNPDPIIHIQGRVNSTGDRGLLGIAVDSDYANNHFVYLLYTYETNASDPSWAKVSQLMRLVVTPQNDVPLADVKVILGTVTSAPCPAPPNTSNT